MKVNVGGQRLQVLPEISEEKMHVYVVVGKAGTWRRGAYERDYTRYENSLVRFIKANNLKQARAIAENAGYDLYERGEFFVRKARKSEADWAEKYALESYWIE